MSIEQADLFSTTGLFEVPAVSSPRGALPDGFIYREDILTCAEATALVGELGELDFTPFEFRGFTGKRQVASFGWKYDFNRTRLCEAPPIPPFLMALRDKVAALRGDAGHCDQVLVSKYEAGAAIGWHRDRPAFGDVVGISLLAPCRFRFRRLVNGHWQRISFEAAPCSGYLLSGPARWEWEHSVAPLADLRYSITFRPLSKNAALGPAAR